MKLLLQSIFFGLALLNTELVLAGPGHDHSHAPEVTATQAKANATKAMQKLIEKGKIEASWKGAKANEPSKKRFGKALEWVVTFDNPKATDKKKGRLYIFLTLSGRVLASNFTGN